MAARSEGIFPREGFNLDNAFEVTTTAEVTPVSFKTIRTFRLIIVGLDVTEPTGDGLPAVMSIFIGNKTINVDFSKVDPNGVYIEHLRGFIQGPDVVRYQLIQGLPNAGTGGTVSVGGVFIELVDGVAR